MKLIKVSLLTTIIILAISCSSNNETLGAEDKMVKSFSDEELELFGNLHSSGLDYNINSFKKSVKANKTSFKSSNGTIDTLALIKFVESETLKFLKENPVIYKGESLGVENMIPITDEQRLNLIRNMHSSDYYLNSNEKVNKFYTQISEILRSVESLETLNFELNQIKETAKIELKEETDLTIIYSMISVAKDSYKYWYSSESKQNLSAKSTGWFSLAVADAVGAYSWGSIGALAGPLGAAVVGINGAIINSSVAYLSSQI